MDELNILFTSAGRRVALLQHFKRALTELGIGGNVVAVDSRKDAPAVFVADACAQVPRVDDPEYVPALKRLCESHRIQLLIPLIDVEPFLLSPHKDEFRDLGVTLLVCPDETNAICSDKRRTHAFLKNAGIPTPELVEPDRILADSEAAYPFLLKPAVGSRSKGVTAINNARELEFFTKYVPNAIVQEMARGQEYTLDVLADLRGRVRCVVPRLRIETRDGEISKGITVKDAALMEIGKQIVESLPGALGCLNVQCFRDPSGSLTCIEINPRFGGGIPLSIEAGADFPRWIIEMLLGRDPDIPFDGWQDGIAMLRYDDAIFVDRETIS